MRNVEHRKEDKKGLSCPACGGRTLRVLYTRRVAGRRMRRRRECCCCRTRVTTYEKATR